METEALDFKEAFGAIRTTVWGLATLCFAIILLSLTPRLAETYLRASEELVSLAEETLREEDVKSLLTPVGSSASGTSEISASDEKEFVAKLQSLGIVNLPSQGVEADFQVVATEWRTINFDGPVSKILEQADTIKLSHKVDILTPNYAEEWKSLEIALVDIDRSGDHVAPPKINCFAEDNWCGITLEIDDEVPGGSSYYIQEEIPSQVRQAELRFPASVVSLLDIPNVRQVASDVNHLSRKEAIARLHELHSEQAKRELQVFGLAIGGSLLWIAPLLVLTTSLFLRAQVRALDRLEPPKRAIQQAFLAPFLEGVSGAALRAFLVAILPVAAQLSTFAVDSGQVKFLASLAITLVSSFVAIGTISTIRQIMRRVDLKVPSIQI